jgi:hypothetical protein
MKTIAELELENPEGFCNPVISDMEYKKLREESKAKADKEMASLIANNRIDTRKDEGEDE